MQNAAVNRWREWRRAQRGRRYLVPEVIQTSSMDCGPAALAALLNGLGIQVSYGRLREACQTDVDGTSIDTLEDLASQIGLQAQQILLPRDHLFLDFAQNLPAIVVTRHGSGMPHFVVCWRLHGALVQVMDPATGRRWQRASRFQQDLYVHSQPMPGAALRKWLAGKGFSRPLSLRMQHLGVPSADADRLLQQARGERGWQRLAQLDAAVRMVADFVSARATQRGREAMALITALTFASDAAEVPDSYWTVRPLLAGPRPDGEAAPAPVEQVVIRGAVLVTIRGRKKEEEEAAAKRLAALPADLRAALSEPPPRPLTALFELLPRGTGSLGLILAVAALVAAGLQIELDVLLRSALHVLGFLHSSVQRLGAPTLFLAFMLGVFGLNVISQWNVTRLGRILEIKLRAAFFSKLPRLNDHYFHSRPISDMTERAHSLARIRQLPQLLVDLLRTTAMTTLTAGALIWLSPRDGWLIVLLLLSMLALPTALQPLLLGLDMRLRTFAGTLMRSYLDALIGLSPTRTHGAERTLARDQEEVLSSWARVRLSGLSAQIAAQAVQIGLGYALVGWLILRYLGNGGDAAGLLLLYYWAMALPGNASELSQTLQQYPDLRNVTMRLLEPLGAPATVEEDLASVMTVREAKTLSIALRDVTVSLGGHPVLQNISTEIAAGTHVAVVGASGAGKSTLVGLLLGFHPVSSGQVLLNGVAVKTDELVQLRSSVAWVDPDVRLWNRSLFDNLHYTQASDRVDALGRAIETADLTRVMARLPSGLATPLGEGGRLVSGGEGQRVRLARALMQTAPQLALLDEPFRGLDRTQRQELLDRARKHWQGTTLIYVSHDIATTLTFPRVLVIDGGRLVEAGEPVALSAQPGSRYAALLLAEKTVRHDLWASKEWQRIAMVDGQLVSGRERDGHGEEA
jgi:ABC-type bacteriocin/lantibiotic exporter with double-glycine peptidase domain